MRYTLVVMGTLTLLAAANACGQTCPLNGVASNKLVCLIPQVYGPFGFNSSSTTPPSQSVLFPGDRHAAHFESDFLSTFAPVNESVGLRRGGARLRRHLGSHGIYCDWLYRE